MPSISIRVVVQNDEGTIIDTPYSRTLDAHEIVSVIAHRDPYHYIIGDVGQALTDARDAHLVVHCSDCGRTRFTLEWATTATVEIAGLSSAESAELAKPDINGILPSSIACSYCQRVLTDDSAKDRLVAALVAIDESEYLGWTVE